MWGVPLELIQKLLGHATIDMTMGHAHLSLDMPREAVEVPDRPAPACDIRATRMEPASGHP
jgi:hypothetical protein